uniref:Elicitin n=1 Tax=Hyaloperonospora arabidopsidis (strain Emoy2) TaxID=559515 RepID=M4BME2_HYAAE
MHSSLFLSFLLTSYGAAADDSCPPATIAKLGELYTNPHLHSCQKIISDTPPANGSTSEQVKALCTSDECSTLINDVLNFKHTDCNMSLVGVELDVRELVNTFEKACQNNKDDSRDSKKYERPPTTKNDTMNHSGQGELNFVKDGNVTQVAENTSEKDDYKLKPPMNNSTAKEFFPMPNTTYKAVVPESAH